MLKIRLTPTGKKHDHHYRIVVAEGKSKLTGRPVASIGHYHPQSKVLSVNRNQLDLWIARGAKPSAKVNQLWTSSSNT